MKKTIIGIVILLSFVSCQIETLSNGKLDGYWHMEKAIDLSNGESKDVTEERIFWCVEGKLIQVRRFGKIDNTKRIDTRGFYMFFSFDKKELVLYDPYINGWHEDWGSKGGDTPLSDISELNPYGIYEIPEHFAIEELTSSKMILASSRQKLFFKKQ